MSIPRETNKEMFVTVENDAIEVMISPPIFDGLLVTGVAPQPHSDTMMVTGFDPVSSNLSVRTNDGRTFVIYNTNVSAGGPLSKQVTYGTSNPAGTGFAVGDIYINTTNNSVWAFS